MVLVALGVLPLKVVSFACVLHGRCAVERDVQLRRL